MLLYILQGHISDPPTHFLNLHIILDAYYPTHPRELFQS